MEFLLKGKESEKSAGRLGENIDSEFSKVRRELKAEDAFELSLKSHRLGQRGENVGLERKNRSRNQ